MFILSTQAEKLVKSVDSLHFINGEYVPSLSGKVKDNINPATEEVISTIAQGEKEEGGIHSFEFYLELSNVCIKL